MSSSRPTEYRSVEEVKAFKLKLYQFWSESASGTRREEAPALRRA